jgi:TonB family protein
VKTSTHSSLRNRILLPLSLLSVIITPVYASSFHTVLMAQRHNVGSAATPGADDVRGSRYYPVDSLVQNEHGVVAVKVFLDGDGDAKDAVVEKSSGFPKLDAAALSYVKENYDYDLAPGERMPESVQVVINFNLAPSL